MSKFTMIKFTAIFGVIALALVISGGAALARGPAGNGWINGLGPYWPPFLYDDPQPACRLVPLRLFRHGRWVVRNVQHCG